MRRKEIGRSLMAARTGADMAGLAHAHWAVRRLVPGGFFADLSEPITNCRTGSDLQRFLGHYRVAGSALPDDLAQRRCAKDFAAAHRFLGVLSEFS